MNLEFTMSLTVDKVKKVKVKALPAFMNRRLKTLVGLSEQNFRDLKAGKATEINEKYFDKSLYKKVKSNGND